MARSSRNNNNNSGKKTVEEIARMGGNAPHRCRGLECLKQEEEGSRDSQSKQTKSSKNNRSR